MYHAHATIVDKEIVARVCTRTLTLFFKNNVLNVKMRASQAILEQPI